MTRHRACLSAAVLAAGAMLLAGCTATPQVQPTPSPEPTPPTAAPTPTDAAPAAVEPQGDPTTLTAGLTTPWSVAFLGDTALISERDTGNILELTGDTTRVVGTIPDVVHAANPGSSGIAVDDRARLYAYSTGADGNRIQRFALTGAPGDLALGGRRDRPRGHPGGELPRRRTASRSAPTGCSTPPPATPGNATPPRTSTRLAGKILRMTPDGASPDDNPFPGSLVYSYGHRNPQGIAWAADGTMFATEFGQDTWDELNVIEPGGNYGWPDRRGHRRRRGLTSTRSSSGRPTRPAPAGSPSSAARSSSPTSAGRPSEPSRSLIPPPPSITTPAPTAASDTRRRPLTEAFGSSPAIPTDTAPDHGMAMTASCPSVSASPRAFNLALKRRAETVVSR